MSDRRALAAAIGGWAMAAVLVACSKDVEIRGVLQQAGKGVPGATVGMECPEGTNRVTTTAAGGEFRFEELGGGVADGCLLQVKIPGTWIPTQSVASQCRKHDATSGLCTEARFSFALP